MRILVIASGNAGKVREFAALLAGLGLEIRPQPEGLEVAEAGLTSTFIHAHLRRCISSGSYSRTCRSSCRTCIIGAHHER
jgi:inosine/xanthosine triphosphate pyrophosphatase family protein